jgi:hypothetical protein
MRDSKFSIKRNNFYRVNHGGLNSVYTKKNHFKSLLIIPLCLLVGYVSYNQYNKMTTIAENENIGDSIEVVKEIGIKENVSKSGIDSIDSRIFDKKANVENKKQVDIHISNDKKPETPDYNVMIFNFINNGKKPEIFNDSAPTGLAMDRQKQYPFYRYLVIKLTDYSKSMKCDSVEILCNVMHSAFKTAYLNNVALAKDESHPDMKKSWAYLPLHNCGIKFK